MLLVLAHFLELPIESTYLLNVQQPASMFASSPFRNDHEDSLSAEQLPSLVSESLTFFVLVLVQPLHWNSVAEFVLDLQLVVLLADYQKDD